MIIKLVEYTIKQEALEDVQEAIRAFVTKVHENEPGTSYEAFRKGDSLSFVHIMRFSDTAAEEQHAKAPYTNDFVAILYPNCEQEPVFTDLSSIA